MEVKCGTFLRDMKSPAIGFCYWTRKIFKCESMLRSVFFPGVNSHAGTLQAETAQDDTTNLPENESITQLRQLGTWVLPSQWQKSLLLFLKGQPQVLGVSGHMI